MLVKLEVSIQQVVQGMVFILFSYGSERSIPATLTVFNQANYMRQDRELRRQSITSLAITPKTPVDQVLLFPGKHAAMIV
jgi:hypothetical protein